MQKLPMAVAEYRGFIHIIRRLQFFSQMKEGQFERLMARIELCSYERGETIFHKGDPPTACYIVSTGSVRIQLGFRFFGLFRRVAHLTQGGLFGEMGIFDKKVRSATAVAEQPTQLFVFTYEQFDKLMEEDKDFANLMEFVVTYRKAENNR